MDWVWGYARLGDGQKIGQALDIVEDAGVIKAVATSFVKKSVVPGIPLLG